ncbi:hypothetical protein [Luteimonas granuli]|uniref:DUF4175 domain-containing protein n=1 Tax=Luteimonas granuli TaxID=1176533 RepID=A0A518N4V2_9GAMM|nr:hypothetical protein [Luteimonas granuli]QDW66949.1 hypothetical protein FPZ22_08620 [Luteimonas granuli]
MTARRLTASGRTRLRFATASVPAPDWPARVVLAAMFLAVVAMLSLPQARGASAVLGWLPLWLAGLPASAWLALAAARRRAESR